MNSEMRRRAIEARDQLTKWLFEQGLPLWAEIGTDWEKGGFFETINAQGKPSNAARRTRVVGRQIYAFATAGAMGWKGPSEQLVRHGIDYLFQICLKPEGTAIAVSEPDGTVIDGRFDLYDHAFALFGLAAAARHGADEIGGVARHMRDALRQGWSHPIAGFEESVPRTLPLKANPHMHLFEAALAWAEVSEPEERAGWDALADDIAELCLQCFIDAETGALREFFGGDWQPLKLQGRDIVEPGHQFEWAWLLERWSVPRGRNDGTSAARRLVEIAEMHGVDPVRGVAIAELNGALEVTNETARLWQQTERIKGWLSMAVLAPDAEGQEAAFGKVADAAAGLQRYFNHPVPGAAWENMRVDGSFRNEEARASSLYHIVCAAAEMHRKL